MSAGDKELLDRVAKAIAIAQWGKANTAGEAWRDLPDIFPAAKAAIAVLCSGLVPRVEALERTVARFCPDKSHDI